MDQPHPFSPPNPHQPFPLSFFEEDMLLFTGGASSHDLAAWENMGIGQGRSVSSLMDPYHLDLQQQQQQQATSSTGAGGATSPTLQSPMDTSTGFGSTRAGGNSGGSAGKKRGSNVDVLGNPLPLPPSILLSQTHHHPHHHHHNVLQQQHRQIERMRRKSSSSNSSNNSNSNTSSTNNGIHNSNAILISEAGNMDVFDAHAHLLMSSNSSNDNSSSNSHQLHHHIQQQQQQQQRQQLQLQRHFYHHQHNLNLTALHYLDTMDVTTDTNIPSFQDQDTHHLLREQSHDEASQQQQQSRSNNGLTNQPQKRRRKDTSTTATTATAVTTTAMSNNNGSNSDDMSSNDDDMGSNDGRRGSLVDGKRPERPRLTEEEKKNNHIASEQKRRMAIRDGFDRLTELVPGIEGQGRSESVVLRKTVDYMRKAIEDRRNLIAQVQELGGEVPQELLLR